MAEQPSLETAIRDLQPGMALRATRWIVAREYEGKWIGLRDSCDEVLPRIFRDADHAIEQVTSWSDLYDRGTSAFELQHIPNDMKETEWMIRVMTHRAL